MTYEQFFSSIEHADAFERLTALETFSVEADDDAVLAQVAGRLLTDADPGVREEAGRMLTALATEEAAGQVVPYIASEDITVRNLAGELLVAIGEPSVQILAPYLDDPDHDVRKFAIDVLAQLPAHILADRIAACLHDPDDNVVLAAVDALGDLGAFAYSEALYALYERDPLARPGIVAALGAFGRAADLDFLEQALQDDDPVVQYTAAEALARQSAPEVMDLLLREVNRVDPMARPVVLSSIVTFYEEHPEWGGLPDAIKGHLLDMLDDFDIGYRCTAVRGLNAFLDAETVDRLMEHAGREDAVDLEIFTVLAAYPDVFHRFVYNVEEGRIRAQDSVGFVLGFLAQQIIPEEDVEDVGQFLVTHFKALDAETKVAAIGLCVNMQHPALHPVIRIGLVDPDAEVSAFTADAAYALGFDASQAA